MSKKNNKVREPTPGSTIAFRTIFIILFIVLIALGILVFLPAAYNATLGQAGFQNGMSNFITKVGNKLDTWYGFSSTAFTQNAYKNGWVMSLGFLSVLIINIYFILKSFSLMGSVKRAHKSKIGLRRFFLALLAIIDICLLACICLIPFSDKLGIFGDKLNEYTNLVTTKFGGILKDISFFSLFKHLNDAKMIGAFWIFIIYILFNLIYLLLVYLPQSKSKKQLEEEAEEEAEPSKKEEIVNDDKEQKENQPDTTNEPTPVPINASEPVTEKEEKTEEEHLVEAVKKEQEPAPEKKKPITKRELSILNTLEPFSLHTIDELPGIYHDDENEIIEDLEPNNLKKANLPDEEQEDIKPVDVLPGIDEWSANPWEADIKPMEEKIIEPIPPVKEEALVEEDMTDLASEEAEKQPVFEEKAPEPLEEVKEEKQEESTPEPEPEPVEKTVSETVEETKEAIQPVEEIIEETPQKEPQEEKVEEDKIIETKPTDIDNSWILPSYDPEEEKRKAEQEALEQARKELEEEKRRIEEERKKLEEEKQRQKLAEEEKLKKLAEEEEARKQKEFAEEEERSRKEEEERRKKAEEDAKPDFKVLETKPVAIDDSWTLPPYDPEAEVKPVEEEKKEEVKPAPQPQPKPGPTVKVIKMNPIHKPNDQVNKPKVAPIAPIKHEETSPEPVAEETKKLEKISGPMHQVAKREAPKDIKPIKARKVKFELSKYRIKTYQGSLTSEEAFLKGVTKVQPTAQPIFAGQNNDSSWKQRRRQEEIRKNGYENINVVKNTNNLKPIKPLAVDNSMQKATSIRDLLKANRADEIKVEQPPVEEKQEEKKTIKPIAPIKPVETSEKKEEKPASIKPDVVRPVAPLQVKKPTAPANRPKPTAIKPVKPIDFKK